MFYPYIFESYKLRDGHHGKQSNFYPVVFFLCITLTDKLFPANIIRALSNKKTNDGDYVTVTVCQLEDVQH